MAEAEEADLIILSGVGVDFAGVPVLDGVSVTIAPGQKWGLIGRNGTGKTTLLNVIVGRLEPTRGQATRASSLRVSLLDQHRELGGAATVWDAAAAAFSEIIALEHALQATADEIGRLGAAVPPELLARYDREMERFAHADGYSIEARVDAVLHGLGFDPVTARKQPVGQLSGGELGRVGLAAQLVAPADVLLLDEPTNHLDLDTTRWLEEYLLASSATVLVISHDRAFIERVADHVLHFEAGTAVPYAGGFSSFVQQRAERRLSQERAFEQQQRQIAAETDYIRRNIAGQNSRQAKGRRTRLDRLPRLSAPSAEDERTMALRLETATRGGNQVLTADAVELRVGERVLLRDFTARVQRGDVIGLVGANGSGKSTLLRAIAGERPLDHGSLRVGESIDVAWYRQDLTQVPIEKTLFDIVHDLRPLWDRGKVQNHLARFGFSGESVQRRAEVLSGGERARVALAMLMLSRANLLLLDEPTNHLDVESIEALEDSISSFEGSVILVSHDRALLRGVATRVWSLTDQHIEVFDASFPEWEDIDGERASRAEQARRAEAQLAAGSRNRVVDKAEERERQQRAERRQRQKELESAEQEVHRIEAQLAEIVTALADPQLYADPAGGVRRAVELNAAKSGLEHALHDALARWERAAQEADETQ